MNEAPIIHIVPVVCWDGNCAELLQQEAVRVLEEGRVLLFPDLSFEIRPPEKLFLNPAIVSGAKNVVFNAATGKLGGCQCVGAEAEQLATMLKRFAESAEARIETLISYAATAKDCMDITQPGSAGGPQAGGWETCRQSPVQPDPSLVGSVNSQNSSESRI